MIGQNKPVAYAVFADNGNIRIWCADPIQAETLRQQYGESLQPLYTAPQPAEQQSISPTLASEAAKHLSNWLEMDMCECEFGHTCGYNEVKRTRDALLVVAEQKPAADDSLTPVPDEVFAAEFAAWWDEHGQFCRAGGGEYERTFAFEAWRHLYPKLMKLQKVAAEQQPAPSSPTFRLGDHVRKTKGSQWKGRVVGTYSTSLTPEGYAVESDTEKGSVQIYPVGALELVVEDDGPDVSGMVEALESACDYLSIGSHALEQVRAALSAHRKRSCK